MEDPVEYAKLLQRRNIIEELIEEYGKNQELADVLQDILYQIKRLDK